jgi:hypothetical protein
MGKLIVNVDITLDGVMHAPGRPDEDTRCANAPMPTHSQLGQPYASRSRRQRNCCLWYNRVVAFKRISMRPQWLGAVLLARHEQALEQGLGPALTLLEHEYRLLVLSWSQTWRASRIGPWRSNNELRTK